MAAKQARKKPLDDVDRAAQGIDRAIHKAIKLLGDEDDAVVQKAWDSLFRRLDPTATVVFLGQALGTSRGDTLLRRRIAAILAGIAQRVREPATSTLLTLTINEQDPDFATYLRVCLGSLGPYPGQPS